VTVIMSSSSLVMQATAVEATKATVGSGPVALGTVSKPTSKAADTQKVASASSLSHGPPDTAAVKKAAAGVASASAPYKNPASKGTKAVLVQEKRQSTEPVPRPKRFRAHVAAAVTCAEQDDCRSNLVITR
jgi:hypothetical protein